jgi:hypothetical protein
MEEVLASVAASENLEMKEILLAPFEDKEVNLAMFHMYLTKASRHDGFPSTSFSVNRICVLMK